MKLDLQENMYIRTNYRKIDKVLKLNESCVKGVLQKDEPYYYDKENIVKASFKIIDLAEENDYIRIITSPKFEYVYSSYGKLVIKDDIDISNYSNEFIAGIVTHQQMEQISYKLGE